MITLLRLLLLGVALTAQDPDPRKAGLDPQKLSALGPKLQEFIDRNEAAGLVTLVVRRGHVASLETAGWQDFENKVPMKADTIFRIASMTKPVTSIALLMLEEEGKLSIDDPVAKFVPEFGKVETPKPITVKHLLTHTSGIPTAMPQGMSDLWAKRNRTLAEAAPAFARAPQFEPGTKWVYCNTGFDTLGRVIEVASGKPFETFLEERLFKPLGMRDTSFYPAREKLARTAVPYKKDGDRLARVESFLGDVPDGKYPIPAGGLFSTAGDLNRLYRMMLGRGTLDGRRYLSEASVEKMTRNHTGDLKAAYAPGMVMGLGWQILGTPTGVTEMLSPGSYGQGGAFGTQGWIDPKKEMFFVLLVQRTGFGDADASELRRVLQSVAVSAVTD